MFRLLTCFNVQTPTPADKQCHEGKEEAERETHTQVDESLSLTAHCFDPRYIF